MYKCPHLGVEKTILHLLELWAVVLLLALVAHVGVGAGVGGQLLHLQQGQCIQIFPKLFFLFFNMSCKIIFEENGLSIITTTFKICYWYSFIKLSCVCKRIERRQNFESVNYWFEIDPQFYIINIKSCWRRLKFFFKENFINNFLSFFPDYRIYRLPHCK